MHTIKVYRVEAPDGAGPYQTNPADPDKMMVVHDLANRHTDWWAKGSHPEEEWTYLHPGPQEDPGMGRAAFSAFERGHNNSVRFGFVSPQHLRNWFGDDVLALDELDCRIVVFELPPESVLRGDYQCVYAEDDADRLGDYPLSWFFDE